MSSSVSSQRSLSRREKARKFRGWLGSKPEVVPGLQPAGNGSTGSVLASTMQVGTIGSASAVSTVNLGNEPTGSVPINIALASPQPTGMGRLV